MAIENPSASTRRPPSSPPGQQERGWLLYLVLALLAAFLLVRPGPSGTQMAYSDLKAKIAAGEAAEVQLSREKVTVTPKKPQKPSEKWVALRVEDPDLLKLIEKQGIKYSGASDGDWFTNLLMAWLLPLGVVLLFWMFIFRRMRPGAGIMSIGRSRAKLVAEEGTGITFADVAGVDEAVDELREVVDFLRSPERFRRVGGRIPKGVLLVGPPGTGKTLLARAVAGEAKVPFFSLTGSDFVEMFVGVGAARVRDLFERAQAKAPCIVFIDELDAIGKARSGAGTFASHDEREQTLNQLLSEMDGFDARKGLIIMGATNRPEILDPALLRPGRFDRQVLVDRPDVRGREAILRVHARDVRLSPEVDLRAIAAITPGFAGAELANVINEAALLAARRGKDRVTMSEANEAVERVVAGLEKKNRVMNPREKEIVAHHEAGHALLAEVLPTTDRVHKVSMIPRGLGALGFTMQIPLEDRYLMTRPELLDKITVLLGGRAAEQIVFGEISTGAQDDLVRATDLARRMVSQFGMSELLGPQSFAIPEGLAESARMLRGLGLQPDRGHGDRTQEIIDREVASVLRRAEQRARAILDDNREHLVRLAARLREKEVLEGAELREILAGTHAPEPVIEPDAVAQEGRWEHPLSH
jgi:cell division protease FtsH